MRGVLVHHMRNRYTSQPFARCLLRDRPGCGRPPSSRGCTDLWSFGRETYIPKRPGCLKMGGETVGAMVILLAEDIKVRFWQVRRRRCKSK